MVESWTSFFVLLLFAQVVGDFVLQTDALARAKHERKVGALLKHTALHGVVAYIVLGLPRGWPVALLLAGVHGLQDALKERLVGRRSLDGASPAVRVTIFAIDQGLHVAVLAMLAAWLARSDVGTPLWLTRGADGILRLLVAVIGLIVSVQVGKVLIGILAAPFALRRAAVDRPADDGPDVHRVVGQLERMLVYLLVVTGNMTAVGFVVAAKSVFRFGDIANQAGRRREAEYILVGSLMSFTWAIFIGWLTAYVLAADLPGT